MPELKHGVVWTDASQIAIGVVLEINGKAVEDAAWLRKKDDYSHINVAELEAVLKGVNLAIKWGLNSVELRIDSATVGAWLTTVISGEKRVHTKGAAEMIIKRRLGNLKDIIAEFGLDIVVSLVPTEKNKADALTRVKKNWLVEVEMDVGKQAHLCAGASEYGSLTELHNKHHMGIDRTLYLAKKLHPEVSRDCVKRVVKNCVRCQSIDPASVVHKGGEVSIEYNWRRLAVDVTHYRNIAYLSMVDCGPGRFAIWRQLKREDAQCITAELENIFMERGPVDELLMDNSTAFRSQYLRDMLQCWNVDRVFRAAYRPGGNGIVKSHHRTIKAIAERGGISPIQAVYWCNSTPRSGQDDLSVPHRSVYKYEWRFPLVRPDRVDDDQCDGLSIKMGDEVWVKPPAARCTSQWGKGIVTQVNFRNNLSVDGMPRHVLDVRPVVTLPDPPEDAVDETIYEADSSEGHEQPQKGAQEDSQRPRRVTRPPAWMQDYVIDSE